MKFLSQITGTVILFSFLLMIIETLSYWLPIGIAYTAALVTLGLVSSLFVYEVIKKWEEK